MKTVLSSRRHHYVARVSIFLITVALIAGMVGCTEERPGYDLIIRSTEGGSVTKPGEGWLFCEEGQVVNLMAKPQEGYEFVNWIAPAGTVADPTAATTTFTMPALAVILTAYFQIGVIEPVNYYLLTMAANPVGGGIATNLDAPYMLRRYQAGDVVDIEATPASNYRFVGWSAPAGTFADPTAATTTFTMPAQAVTVTANFEDVS